MYNIESDSFVVVSDFHSNKWPLDKVINYYINEYDKVYILGDATDRGEKEDGTGGLDLLFKIRELTKKYPNRVFYIPGNHDEFLYGYGKYKDYGSNRLLRLNHGEQTIKDIDNLSKNNPEKLEELMDWLGNLPLQKEHFYQGKRYVLAHALFDEMLFKKNKKFSLEDYRNNEGNRGPYVNMLWFRVTEDSYNPSRLPKKGVTMIIGHTPLCYRENISLDLKNNDGDIIEVKCVDGGITYDGTMLKYSVANRKAGLYQTEYCNHINRGSKPKYDDKYANRDEIINFIDKRILSDLGTMNSIDDIIEDILDLYYKNNSTYFNCNGKVARIEDAREYLDEVVMSYIEQVKDYKEALNIYITEVAMDYISNCLLKKYGNRNKAQDQIKSLLKEEDYDYITRYGNARNMTMKIGIDNINNWLEKCKYVSYQDYLTSKFGKQYDY